ncbi:MAG: FUSC family protein, partial [Polyangiales bacterium]
QAQVFRALREKMVHTEVATDVHKLSQGQVTLLDQLKTAFEGGASESYDVHEVRGLWAQLHSLSSDLRKALERWQESFADIEHLDIAKVLPDLPPYFDELDRRFMEIERMLGGNSPEAEPKAVTVTASKTELHALSQFERAAVTETWRSLGRVEALTGAIFACVRTLKGFGPATTRPVPAPLAEPTADPLWLPIFDPDRIRAAVRAMVSVWVFYLLWVYLNPPGHQALIPLGIAMTSLLGLMPFVRPTLLLRAFAIWMPFGLAVYVFVLPHLSSFLGLGLVIFAFTFVVAYFLKGLSRVGGMLALLLMVGIDNQQTYDFASQANSYFWALLSVAVPVATSAITFSLRPEKAFLRMINRFFRSFEFVISSTTSEARSSSSLVERWKLAYHRQELRTLPQKLGTWGHFIDHKLFPNTAPEQVQALVTSLQALVYRLQALIEARQTPQADPLVQHLLDDLRAWHIVLQELFHRLAESPETVPSSELQVRLATRLANLEKRITETLNQADAVTLTGDNYENFYQLLGGYRGVSEAAVAYAGVAEKVNWAEWREARF